MSEYSKANDLGFIEVIVKETYDNIQADNFSQYSLTLDGTLCDSDQHGMEHRAKRNGFNFCVSSTQNVSEEALTEAWRTCPSGTL